MSPSRESLRRQCRWRQPAGHDRFRATKRVLLAIAITLVARPALATAPGVTEITCDVDRTQFRNASQGLSDVTVRFWSGPAGGVECASNVVRLADVESVRLRREPIGRGSSGTFQRLRLIIGDDITAAEFCPDARTWVDLQVGSTVLGCDSVGRRRLVSVPFARHSDDAFVMAPGTVMAFTGAVAPTGWLLCDGSAVSRTTYGGLFAVLGTTYGAGDGSSTFNVPDARGRVPVGLGANADVNLLGKSDGLAVASRTPVPSVTVAPHSHTVDSHVHSVNIFSGPEAAIGFDPSRRYPKNDYDNFSHGHGVVGSTGAAAPGTSVASPATTVQARGYVTMNYIIKY